MTVQEQAQHLLEEFNLCIRAKPKHNAIDIQLEKDAVSKWAYHLNRQLGWGTENEIAEACNQLELRLKMLKEKLIIEILTNGSV
jgi:hypothetical protein